MSDDNQSTQFVDPPDFDRTLVPSDATADLFFDGEAGRGLTNEEWHESKRRRLEHEREEA